MCVLFGMNNKDSKFLEAKVEFIVVYTNSLIHH